MPLAIFIIIAVLGFCGFAVSHFIYTEKQKPTPIVCPVGFDCDAVVRSRFGSLMGVRLEVAGMAYYGLIALCYTYFVFLPSANSPTVALLLFLISAGGFLMSFSLSLVQTFIIKQYCTWCLVSAFITTAIFILMFINL
ncbi:MAG: vitamin K epoxide reductase family protein [Candidatus Paceibacterota bacterium]|jgi:uncharacterized membrane protein